MLFSGYHECAIKHIHALRCWEYWCEYACHSPYARSSDEPGKFEPAKDLVSLHQHRGLGKVGGRRNWGVLGQEELVGGPGLGVEGDWPSTLKPDPDPLLSSPTLH